jgi:hypothetical protein
MDRDTGEVPVTDKVEELSIEETRLTAHSTDNYLKRSFCNGYFEEQSCRSYHGI